jgi:hypothetical protein
MRNPRIAVVAPVYEYLPVLVPSLLAQSYHNWKAYICHDGPVKHTPMLPDFVRASTCGRVAFTCSEERMNCYGHNLREDMLKNPVLGTSDLVLITNGDNYYLPNFLQDMIQPFISSGKRKEDYPVAAYCGFMLHNYFGYPMMETGLECGKIDIGCMIVRTEIAREVGWPSYEHSSDWIYIEKIMSIFGADRIKKVDHQLLIHN